MKKVVVKLNPQDDKIRQNPMKAVSSIENIVSMEFNSKDNKITIVGDVDPVEVVKKLRKWYPKIDTVGPVKEEKKPEKPAEKKDEKAKVLTEEEQYAMLLQSYKNYHNHAHYNAHYGQTYPINHYYEENTNPNGCVIC